MFNAKPLPICIDCYRYLKILPFQKIERKIRQTPAKFYYDIERFLTSLSDTVSRSLIVRSGLFGCIRDNRPLTIFS
jgi:hypothetical protein